MQKAIAHLYQTFSAYTTAGMAYCKCGCKKEEDVLKLHSKPLRALQNDDLIAYHGSALYTWGEVEHYKHFLPRICELISAQRDFGFVTLDEFYVKLQVADWLHWPLHEQQAIIDYVVADWIDFANKRLSEISTREIEMYSKFFGVKEVLRLWQILETPEALRNFVYFFYFHGSHLLDSGVRIADKKYQQEFLDWLKNDALTDKLESSFFAYELMDEDYADKISTVLLIIEQERKIINLE